MEQTKIDTTKEQYVFLKTHLNERQWRLFLATEAKKYGFGGIRAVARIPGSHKNTISRGIADMDRPPLPQDRIRLPGGGRKQLTATDPTLEPDLEDLLEPKGDPMRAVQWTTKSPDKLAGTLNKVGHKVSATTIVRILKAKEFSLQANKKNIEGVRHYPPATSKWNKIEHRLFSYISINWRGKPLTSLETVIELISHTTTKGGLTVIAVPDTNTYEKGIKISDEEMKTLNLERHEFHGDTHFAL